MPPTYWTHGMMKKGSRHAVDSTLKCNFTDEGDVKCGSILISQNQHKELPYETLHAPHQ